MPPFKALILVVLALFAVGMLAYGLLHPDEVDTRHPPRVVPQNPIIR